MDNSEEPFEGEGSAKNNFEVNPTIVKKETSSLTKKLKQYSAFSGSLLAITGVTHAQIIYTDIDPDVTLDHFSGYLGSYELDVNNDGVTDFQFLSYFDSNNYGINWGVLGVSPVPHSAANVNAIAGTSGSTSNGNVFLFPLAIMENDTIDDDLPFHPFYDNSNFPVSPPLWFKPNQGGLVFGNWKGMIDRFLAFQFSPDGSSTYFGWARCDVSDLGEITIKDYAYNSISGAPLTAGQGDPLIAPTLNESNHISVFAFEKNVYISTRNLASSEMTITVTDMLGKMVANSTTEGKSVQLDLNNLVTGMYLVAVSDGTQTKTSKVCLR